MEKQVIDQAWSAIFAWFIKQKLFHQFEMKYPLSSLLKMCYSLFGFFCYESASVWYKSEIGSCLELPLVFYQINSSLSALISLSSMNVVFFAVIFSFALVKTFPFDHLIFIPCNYQVICTKKYFTASLNHFC